MLGWGCLPQGPHVGVLVLRHSCWGAHIWVLTWGAHIAGVHSGGLLLQCSCWAAHTGVLMLGGSCWSPYTRVLPSARTLLERGEEAVLAPRGSVLETTLPPRTPTTTSMLHTLTPHRSYPSVLHPVSHRITVYPSII